MQSQTTGLKVVTNQEKEIDFISSNFRLHQVIDELTRILYNSSSCVGLLFTCQLNLNL